MFIPRSPNWSVYSSSCMFWLKSEFSGGQEEDMRGIPGLSPPPYSLPTLVSCSQTVAGPAPRVDRSWGQTSGQQVPGQSLPCSSVSQPRLRTQQGSPGRLRAPWAQRAQPLHNRPDVRGNRCTPFPFRVQKSIAGCREDAGFPVWADLYVRGC